MKRKDGKKVTSVEPILKLFPYLLPNRCDSQVFAREVLLTDGIDEYLKEKRSEGLEMNYLHLFIAVYVRLLAERPRLNRFIINREIYARNNIQISMTIKKKLREDAPEVTVKFTFNGTENLKQIVDKVNEEIRIAIHSEDDVKVEEIARKISSLPRMLKALATKLILFADNHGFLPKDIIDASPFHSSMYLTYLKSIRQDFIYHHLYNLGTAGLFVAVGKIVELPIVIDGKVEARKCCEVGYTVDERICDGLYLAQSLKRAKVLFEKPHLLEVGLEELPQDS